MVAHPRTRLLREAVLLTRISADAEDLGQRTLERGIASDAGRFEKPLAWLRRTMRNLHIDHLRRRRVRQRHAERAPEPVAAPSRAHTRLDVGAALAQLPAEQAQALLLVLGERYTYVEVAELQRVPVNTVKSRVARARARLAALLEKDR